MGDAPRDYGILYFVPLRSPVLTICHDSTSLAMATERVLALTVSGIEASSRMRVAEISDCARRSAPTMASGSAEDPERRDLLLRHTAILRDFS